MNVGILGLGLIGGSLARAYSISGHSVYAAEVDEEVFSFARLSGAVSDKLAPGTIGNCDLILLAIYPAGSASWLTENAKYISKETLVIDCCGMKQGICDCGFRLSKKYGFTFIGGHPMAGSQFSGFKYSRANMFHGAPMVLVPDRNDDIEILERAKKALEPCDFGSFTVTTAKKHDEMIAFTSQMPHILSNAFIKSPTAQKHKGFSAGSYKDLTRVAWLNPQMWAELCLENKENTVFELETYISSLKQYLEAIKNDDLSGLIALFDEGRKCKEAIDG